MFQSRIVLLGLLALSLFWVTGCEKNQADASKPGQGTTPRTTPPSPAPGQAQRPAMSLTQVLEQLKRWMTTAQREYSRSYHQGKIKSWTAYNRARSAAQKAWTLYQGHANSLQRRYPRQAPQIAKALAALLQAIRNKAPASTSSKLAYRVLAATFQIDPKNPPRVLKLYTETLKEANKKLLVDRIAGAYRIGLLLGAARPYYTWYQRNRSDHRRTIRPGKGETLLVGVFLRDPRTGAPLPEADVSFELLDPKSKKVLLTKKLDLLQERYPRYVGNIALPAKKKKVLARVVVSPPPLTRTALGQKRFLRSATLLVPAKIHKGTLEFLSKSNPSRPPALGVNLLAALGLVSGKLHAVGPYLVGFALTPPERRWVWKRGVPFLLPPNGKHNAQLLVVLQDRRTGLIVPNARVEVLLYWEEPHKGTYRRKYKLKPLLGRCYRYGANLRLKARTYEIKVQIHPSLSGRFRPNRPLSSSVRVPNHTFKPPAPPKTRRRKGPQKRRPKAPPTR